MKIARVVKAKNVREGDWVLAADSMTIGAGYGWQRVMSADNLSYTTPRITITVGNGGYGNEDTFDPDDRVLVMR